MDTRSTTSGEQDVLERMWSRRTVLGAGLGGAAALALAGRAGAQSATQITPAGARSQRSFVEPGDLHFLVQRTSQGWTESLWAEATSRGYAGYLEWQLDHLNIDDSPLDATLTAFPSLAMTSRQIVDTYFPGSPSVPVLELKKAHALRSVLSKRQLFERMVELWTDHFNIDQTDGENQVLKTTDDRDVIRAHALGNFHDLVIASAHSGAMLYYLDNYTNKNTGVNENYARELMELHTLSPGNYTETDVRELAKILTGWTIFRQADPAYGLFRYRPEWHDNAAHTLLGTTYGPNGGQAEGEAALVQLLEHPACAQFVAKKLCKRLLAYDPPQAVVDEVAQAYTRTHGDIKAMIRTAFKPENVALVNPYSSAKLKRPFTFLTSLLRATGATYSVSTSTAGQRLLDELVRFGQVPFAWGPPDGYPDSLEYWGNAVLPRWSFASRLLDGSITGWSVDVTTLFSGVAQSQAAERANQILAGGRLAAADVAEVHAYVMSFGSLTTQVKRDALALSASSPSYQFI